MSEPMSDERLKYIKSLNTCLNSDTILEILAEVDRLKVAVSELEPRAAFGDQCYQDNCEGAYIEASVVKRLKAELANLVVRCSDCGGTQLYKRNGNEITVIHNCVSNIGKNPWLAAHDAGVRKPLEAELERVTVRLDSALRDLEAERKRQEAR